MEKRFKMDIKGGFTKDFDRLLQDCVRFEYTSKTVYDDGNEEYIVLLLDFMEYEDTKEHTVLRPVRPPYDYDKMIKEAREIIEEVMEADCFQGGDHACTLESVTHGNSTIIALITCCK